MSCTLNRFNEYVANKVNFNETSGDYVVFLQNPPVTCAEGIFNSKKALIKVDGIRGNSSLTFDSALQKPVINVPSRASIIVTDKVESHWFMWTLGITFLCIGGYLILKKMFEEKKKEEDNITPVKTELGRLGSDKYTSRANSHAARSNSSPASSGGTTVINNTHSSNDGLVTGMVLGHMMSHPTYQDYAPSHNNGYSTPNTPTPSTDYSSDSGSYSSDNSSYSSSSDSSYSSDSSSSYSSDSGSSSDSSFSSDF